jgi:hypothetical protein
MQIIFMRHLLRRHVVTRSPHVNFLVDVQTGYDEEDPRAPSSPGEQPPQSEDDGPLVLLLSGVQRYIDSLTWTTLTTMKMEKGRVARMSRTEQTVRI